MVTNKELSLILIKVLNEKVFEKKYNKEIYSACIENNLQLLFSKYIIENQEIKNIYIDSKSLFIYLSYSPYLNEKEKEFLNTKIKVDVSLELLNEKKFFVLSNYFIKNPNENNFKNLLDFGNDYEIENFSYYIFHLQNLILNLIKDRTLFEKCKNNINNFEKRFNEKLYELKDKVFFEQRKKIFMYSIKYWEFLNNNKNNEVFLEIFNPKKPFKVNNNSISLFINSKEELKQLIISFNKRSSQEEIEKHLNSLSKFEDTKNSILKELEIKNIKPTRDTLNFIYIFSLYLEDPVARNNYNFSKILIDTFKSLNPTIGNFFEDKIKKINEKTLNNRRNQLKEEDIYTQFSYFSSREEEFVKNYEDFKHLLVFNEFKKLIEKKPIKVNKIKNISLKF